MGDTKQVRVDNWGTYFLQRLQQFFNKTDYCDLTLQFEGNVQLKVHRLVMSACTEYFHFLEQTCETVDDVLMMPPDLQADVILPIVNFMYTGILEFQLSTFEKLYKTAELMHIPVLTKLLDAQKRPVNPKVKKQTLNTIGKKTSVKQEPDLPATLPGRKLPVWKRKTAPISQVSGISSIVESKFTKSESLFQDNAPKPTRFEWPEEDSLLFNLMDSSFDDISYTSKPLLTQDEEQRSMPPSTFDEVKNIPSTNKRPRILESNATVDMEEMKDYIKEQKIRSDMLDYDDEDVDNDLTYEESSPKPEATTTKRKSDAVSSTPMKKVRFSVVEKENKEATINISPTSNMTDHTKIISEVLKKYPHLVKKNKNIRLKILAKNPKTSTESPGKVQTMKTASTSKVKMSSSSPKVITKTIQTRQDAKKEEEGPWVCTQCSVNGEQGVKFVLYYLYLKHMSEVHNEKIDSRICKFCGHKSTRHQMLLYHQFTKHGIQPPSAYKFPKCPQCPYIAVTEASLQKHKENHAKFEFECGECKIAFNNIQSLQSHMQITAHSQKSGKTNFDCQYCTKKFQHGGALFAHIKHQHREEAKRDGMISIDDVESFEEGNEEDDMYMDQEDSKEIKVLSNIKVPQQIVTEGSQLQRSLERSSEAEALSNVASGIATSLGLVDIVVLDDNQQYILHSNDQQLVPQQSLSNTSNEFMLPELSDTHTFATNQNIGEHNVITQSMLNNSDITSTDELVMVLTDHDYNDGNAEILNNDNSNIVVLYSHPVEGQENQYITSQGNIMLNSQTGMLEIRNTIPETNQRTEQIVMNPDESQIESIEMIQREINSHQDGKGQEPCSLSNNVIMTSSITTLATTVEPLTQNTAILENESVIPIQPGASVPTILDNNDLELQKNLQFNQPGVIVSQDVQHLQSNEINEQESVKLAPESNENIQHEFPAAEEPMEIEEDCRNNENMVGDIELLNPPHQVETDECASAQMAEQVLNEEAMQTEKLQEETTLTEEQKNDLLLSSEGSSGVAINETVRTSELPQEILEEINESENEHKIVEEAVQEVNKDLDNVQEQEQQQELEIANNAEEAVVQAEATEEPIKEDNVNLETTSSVTEELEIATNQEVIKNDHVEGESSENVQLSDSQDILQFQDKLLEAQRTILEEQDEILETEKILQQTNAEPEQQSVQEESTEEVKEATQDVDSQPPEYVETENLQMQDENVEKNIVMQEESTDLQENIETQDIEMSEAAPNENMESVETTQDENSMMVDEKQESLDSRDACLPIHDENAQPADEPQMENTTSQDATSQNEETFQSQEETLNADMGNSQNETQSPDEENSQSQDDNNSQVSQSSSADDKDEKTLNTFTNQVSRETTKIAILDDWEDTDSQPSDHGEVQKSASVNKIIDDWAEDEEDDSAK